MRNQIIDWDALGVGYCQECGKAASLFRGLCYDCRPDFGYTLTQNGWVLNVMQSMTTPDELERLNQEAKV